MNGGRTIAERYASSLDTSDLTVSLEHRTDADYLLAAGYAAAANRNGLAALMAYRMKVSGDLASRPVLLELLVDRLQGQSFRKKLPAIQRARARQAAEAVLGWWLDDVCRACTGRLMDPIPGTPHLSAHFCKACAGTGKRALPELGPRSQAHAAWLAAELDRMLSFIVGDMARILSPKLDLP